jgi:hypothetical protein
VSAYTKHVIHDGLDVRAEFSRLARLPGMHPAIRRKEPQLQITQWRDRRPRRLGCAWWTQHRIKVNLHPSLSRYDVQEVLIHELAHIDANNRAADATVGEQNRTRDGSRVGHSPFFWERLDALFEEAYPGAGKFLEPRKNKFHGRYSRALKRYELFGDKPFDQEIWDLHGILAQVASEKMVNGARVQVIRELEPAAASDAPLAPVIPIRPKKTTSTKTSTRTLDERVHELIALGPVSREQLAWEYEQKYGPYPGKSVYNSVWRLRRDGRVDRNGHLWYAK